MRKLFPFLLALLCLSYFAVPTFARRAISLTHLLSEADTAENDASFTTTGTFTCANTAMCYCGVRNTDGTPADDTAATLTQTGQTWTSVGVTIVYDTIAATTQQLSVFRTVGAAATAATVTAAFGADSQTSISVTCVQADGADLTGTNGSNSVVQTDTEANDATAAITSTLGSALQTGSAVVAFGGTSLNGATMDAESGYTAGTETSIASPNGSLRAMWRTDELDLSPTFTASSGSGNNGTITLEVRVAGAAATNCLRSLLGVGCN